jgi:hypothetical protein
LGTTSGRQAEWGANTPWYHMSPAG